MNIDEAIRHCEEVARSCDWQAAQCDETDGYECHEKAGNEECASDHRQLAAWLRELKDLREENKMLKQECDRLINEKGELSKTIGAVKLSDLKEVADHLRKLKDELSKWLENPFDLISEECERIHDCRQCRWYGKCPYPKNYGSYPEDWRNLE